MITIAIDGYSSSGKSTMAKQLARAIGYKYVDSGAMYRAVTLAAMERGLVDANHTDTKGIIAMLPQIDITFSTTPGGQVTMLNGKNVEQSIRSMEVSNLVSTVAAIPQVRRAMVALQQGYGKEGGIVMDGRDIGTTVFPDAQMKLFVNAPAETRAQRRYKELTEKGIETTYEDVLANVKSRDTLDETRTESPLRRADDAIDFDNSDMTPEQQDAALLKIFKEINERYS